MNERNTSPTSMNAEPTGEFRGFMCLIDWEYELGVAEDGNRIYPSVESLKAAHPCVNACGIVEVEVRLRRVVQAPIVDNEILS